MINTQDLIFSSIEKDYNKLNESIFNSYSINTQDCLEEKEKFENIFSNLQPLKEIKSINTSNLIL